MWTYYVGFTIIIVSIIWFNIYPVQMVKVASTDNSELSGEQLDEDKKSIVSKTNSYVNKNVSIYKDRGLNQKAISYMAP